jgi:uncharacterized membrane protein YagU involved in acid resistance
VGFPMATQGASAVRAPSEVRSLFGSVLLGGMLVAVLDLTEAIAFVWLAFGTPPYRVPQSIAAALLGRQSFAMGASSVALGLTLHLAVAFSVVAVYAVASRQFSRLQRHPIASGLLYGVAVFALMHAVVLPLSALPPELRRQTLATLLNGVLGHALLVGLPTAWAVRRSFRQSPGG